MDYTNRNLTIHNYFKNIYEAKSITVFSLEDIKKIYFEYQYELRMKTYGYYKFLTYLTDNGYISYYPLTINKKGYYKSLYISTFFDEKDSFNKALEVALKLIPKGYITLYTAIFIHNLTLQVPKTVYINKEQKLKYDILKKRNELIQKNIDKAFCIDERRGETLTQIDNVAIYQYNGKDTKSIGVISKTISNYDIKITDIERTLIDITIHPHLSGGINEVMNAYNYAIKSDTYSIDVKRIIYYLKKINYIYPFHQSIGFLLDRVGVDKKLLDEFFKSFSFNYDFYLLHSKENLNKQSLSFSKKWRLFYPNFLDQIYN